MVNSLKTLCTPTHWVFFILKISSMSNQKRDSMIIYRSFYEAIKDLPAEDQAIIWKAVFEFGLNFSEIELTGISSIIFKLIKPQLEANLKKYKNGLKGGAPKNANDNQNVTKTEPKENLEITKAEPKQNQNGIKPETNVNDNVNDNENENNNYNLAGNKRKTFFAVDANVSEINFRKYLFECIKEKQSSRDALFMQNKIDLTFRNQLWEDFIKNAIMESPQIEDDKHAWNCFKKFVKENATKYKMKLNRNPT